MTNLKLQFFLQIFLLILHQIVCDKDLYKILEIKCDATQNEIKHKYRQLSRIYHPDKNKSPEEAEKK
jgi:preprotein translocase subunit Sec63